MYSPPSTASRTDPNTCSYIHSTDHGHPLRRIPFFFEPNFDALIKPLPAALRIQDGTGEGHGEQMKKRYQPIVYGEFLKRKVGNNFAGGSRYD